MTINLTHETLAQPVIAAFFFGFVAVTLFGAVLAAASRRLVYSVSGLALSFVGLAGLYFFLNSPFLALMQILIYVGAVCVAIMFALMLAGPQDAPPSFPGAVKAGVASLFLAGPLALGLIAVIVKSRWTPAVERINSGTVKDLGSALLTRYGLAFELISVLLLLAILGALVVAREGRRKRS
ncbi:MAG: NADH-quinone oxidoreductase subunit J [Verrucomicrobia bacterium]|nr:NADH-quinone oxidoreductase subunit J [Verrucomicrobiota bacterium]